MKNAAYIVLLIILCVVTANVAIAKGEETVLCKMLASSLTNPWQFDNVVADERKRFDNTMIRYIKSHINKLAAQAKQREAVCESYKNKSMGYDICMGNNPARELAAWLDSLSYAIKGLKWEQTKYGEGQLKAWSSCNNPAFCEQLRLAAAKESRLVCPGWLANK
jgi:hypothetical protein